MGRIIGIDLGTTNSVAAYWTKRRPKIIEIDTTGSYITPSVVTVDPLGNRVIGHDARDRIAGNSQNIIYSVKRLMGMEFEDPRTQSILNELSYQTRRADNGEVEILMGGNYYSPTQISAMILQDIKSHAEAQLGDKVTHAVITVPAYFSQRQKDATREAGKLAGLHVARIINEPTAAALAFGVDAAPDQTRYVLVYDLGGGTFDVSILMITDTRFEVFNIDGDNFLGGDDFDQSLLEMIANRIGQPDLLDDGIARAILKNRAEQMKVELSRAEKSTKRDSFIGQYGKHVDFEVTITRAEFEALILSRVDQTIEIVKRALKGAHLEINELSHVLLVGGSTRIPLVRQKLKDFFGEGKLEIDVDPMQCVALGAAVQSAAILSEEMEVDELEPVKITGIPAEDVPEIHITDITSKYIGIRTQDEQGFGVVIPKGTLYGTQLERRFFTNAADQRMYFLKIYEVEAQTQEDAEKTPQAQWEMLGTVMNDQLSPGLPANTPVNVVMTIDLDGILRVSSYVSSDKQATLVEKSLHMGRHSDTMEKQNALNFLANMFRAVSELNDTKRFLDYDQQNRLKRLSTQADTSVQSNASGRPVDDLLSEMNELRDELPVPVEDIFWTYLIASDEKVTAMERSQLDQLIRNMLQAIDRDDVDTVNAYLNQLREKNGELQKRIAGSVYLRKERASFHH